MVGVTGATGEVGGRVAARLADRGVEQRLVVRDRGRAPQLPGADLVLAPSYGEDSDAMHDSLAGVDTLFLVSATEQRDRVNRHRDMVDDAVAAGVERIVYLSFLSCAPDATFTFARDHFHTEQHIRASGLGFTFLRDSIYLEYVPIFAAADGVIRGPAGEGHFAPVARDDVAAVAAAVLTERGHDGKAYDVTGPQKLTMSEAAEVLSDVAGQPVTYEEETLAEARRSRKPTGAPAWEIEGWVTSYAAIASGELDVVSNTVRTIAGHEPQGLKQFLEEHPETYAHIEG